MRRPMLAISVPSGTSTPVAWSTCIPCGTAAIGY